MRVLVLALLAGLAAVAVAADPAEKVPGVVDLDPTTFDKTVNGGRLAIVDFYAPWCGHCKTLAPELAKLGAAVAADPALASRVVVAKVDADAHRELGTRFGVRGFPTVKLFKRGAPTASPEDYAGARTADAMLAALKDAVAADADFARVAALDALAAAVAADPTPAAVAKLEAAAGKLTGDDAAHGALYVKYAAKGAAKGASFFEAEAARLDRMLASGAVGGARVGELSAKLSVLGAFKTDAASAA